MTGGIVASLPDVLMPHPVAAGSRIIRVHKVGIGPHWYGPGAGKPPAYRFDAPTQEYGTLYAADALRGAFVETILRRPKRLIARPFVDARQWSVLRVQRDLLLARLFDNGLQYYGQTADICTGDDYGAAQALAAALHARFADLDGIAYRARHNNGEICYAIFDRVDRVHLPVVEERRFANERVIVDALMREHGASFDPLTDLPTIDAA